MYMYPMLFDNQVTYIYWWTNSESWGALTTDHMPLAVMVIGQWRHCWVLSTDVWFVIMIWSKWLVLIVKKSKEFLPPSPPQILLLLSVYSLQFIILIHNGSIYTCLAVFLCCRLISTLEAHLDAYGLDPLPEGFAKLFPGSITLGQAVASWKHIVHYQCHLEYNFSFHWLFHCAVYIVYFSCSKLITSCWLYMHFIYVQSLGRYLCVQLIMSDCVYTHTHLTVHRYNIVFKT